MIQLTGDAWLLDEDAWWPPDPVHARLAPAVWQLQTLPPQRAGAESHRARGSPGPGLGQELRLVVIGCVAAIKKREESHEGGG
jgi:hypothetical protein